MQSEAVRMFHLCLSPFPFPTHHLGFPSSLPPYIIRQKWDTAKEEGLDHSGLLTSLPPSHFLVPPHCAHCHLKDTARTPMLIEPLCQSWEWYWSSLIPPSPGGLQTTQDSGTKGAVVGKPRLLGDFPNTSTQWPSVTVLLA